MAYCVYVHTNKNNGKKYVGMTGRDPETRWAKGEGYQNCKYFYDDIQRYGWDNFEHEIIKKRLSFEDAEYYERKYIFEWFTDMPEYGYNTRKGGQAGRKPKEPQFVEYRAVPYADKETENRRKAQTKTKKPIVCITTGKRFESVADAARYFGVAPASITAVLKGRAITAKGYRFRYVKTRM